MGMILFTICLGIYKMPFYWTLPFLQQEEIRYMLLLGSIFAVFRLTLRSMVQQLDSILEKSHRWSIYSYIGKSNCETVYGDTNYNCLWRRNYNGFCCKQQYSANTVRVCNTYMCDSPESLARSEI